MEFISFNPSYKQEDAEQMVKAIEAFKRGEEQPKGRFVILGVLPKEKYGY